MTQFKKGQYGKDAVAREADPLRKAGIHDRLTEDINAWTNREEPPKEKRPFIYMLSLDDFFARDDTGKKEFLDEFIIQSNLIEGIDPNKIETRVVGEELKPYYEFTDHYKALDYVLENYEKPLTTTDILHIHQILMKNIFLEEGKDLAVFNKIRKRSKAYKQIIEVFGRRAGNYRQTKMRVGDRYGIMNGCPYHRSIPKAMRKLEEKFANLDNPSREDILELHYEFETIHPFVDGNGRTGRLVMNWLSLQHLGEFIVVDNDVKQDYYAILQKYKPKFKRDNPNVRFYKDQDNTGKFEMEVYRMMQEQDERLNNKK